MYCKNCGQEVNDNAVVCIHCGCAIDSKRAVPETGESKSTVGILMGLFLGLIGLLIGYLMYNDKPFEKSTFVKGWVKGFIISIVVGFVSGLLYSCVVLELFL